MSAAEEAFVAQSPKGTHDFLPPESERFAALVARFAALAGLHAYGLAHTPMFEDVRLFRRGIGESTEVVGKEMYEFEDRGGRRLALRPEGTAPIVRAFVQHRPATPWRVWYLTPAFRYERSQAGRYRQHHQVGVEVLGTDDPDVDVEVIALAHDFYVGLGLSDLTLRLNTLGDATCRPAYLDVLRGYLTANADDLCEEHRGDWEKNPMRVFDCKRAPCQGVTAGAPVLAGALCGPCTEHFDRVTSGLDAAGIGWVRDDRLVRGLDYYTRTLFEFTTRGVEFAIGGGGRYDGLVEAIGGPATPGIGFGSGVERLLLACDAQGVFGVDAPATEFFVVDLTGGDLARDLVLALRRGGRRAERAYDARSMKAQLKAADRSGATTALIIGPSERERGTVVIRDLAAGTQMEAELAGYLSTLGATRARPKGAS